MDEQHAGGGRGQLEPITVTIEEAKRISGLGLTKIWELIKDGHLQTKKVGRRRLVNYASLKALLAPDLGD